MMHRSSLSISAGMKKQMRRVRDVAGFAESVWRCSNRACHRSNGSTGSQSAACITRPGMAIHGTAGQRITARLGPLRAAKAAQDGAHEEQELQVEEIVEPLNRVARHSTFTRQRTEARCEARVTKNHPKREPPQHMPATRLASVRDRLCHLMSPSIGRSKPPVRRAPADESCRTRLPPASSGTPAMSCSGSSPEPVSSKCTHPPGTPASTCCSRRTCPV